MKSHRLSRRALLSGALGTSIALPWLEAMLPIRNAHGAAEKPPLRFVALLTCGGIFPERFWPRLPGEALYPMNLPPKQAYLGGAGSCNDDNLTCATVPATDSTDYVFSPGLEPLARHRKDLLIVEGLDAAGGPGHDQWPSMLTGRKGRGTGISLDQAIANHISGDTKFKSLNLGARTDNGTVFSYYGVDQPALQENDPQAVFDRVFAEVAPPDTSAIDRMRAERKSVLDAALAEITDLNQKVSQADRVKLQNYFDSIREVESRLDSVAGGLSCGRPKIASMPQEKWWDNDINTPTVLSTHLDMLAMAFACDLTRVATVSVGNGNSAMSLPWLGVTESFHDGLGHAMDGNMDAQNKIGKIDAWNSEMLAGFIDRLKSIPEGDGTVFDSTVILWVQELTKGNAHNTDNMPHVLAGSAQGYFKTGRYLRLPRGGKVERPPYPFGRWSNDLKLSVLQSMGVDANTFGDPEQFTAPLDVLRG